MSKIAEQKALEAYPEETYYDRDVCDYVDVNATRRDGYIDGYDQAMQDTEKQVEESIIEKSNGEVTIEDLVAYNQGFKIGRDLTFQDVVEKAKSFIENKVSDYFWWNQEECFVDFDKEECIKDFKNYMQNES